MSLHSVLPFESHARHQDRDHWLDELVAGTNGAVDRGFLFTLVRLLARSMHARHAFVSETTFAGRVRTLAFWSAGEFAQNVEYETAGSCCADVLAGDKCVRSGGVELGFWRRTELDSYTAVPLRSHQGLVLGHLCIFDEVSNVLNSQDMAIFDGYASRAAAELDRRHVALCLKESDKRLSDLFDEAPIAYVLERLDTRFIRANEAAISALGISPREVTETYGSSFIPKSPGARRRFESAFASVKKGAHIKGVVLELQRKDTGAPLWVQWWSKPDVTGTYTRTMFIDITPQVLLQQGQDRLQAQNLYLQEEIKATHNFDEIIGSSQALRGVLERVQCVAPTDASVLIGGETGTGKELIARAIHSTSSRADKPFIKVNCAALPAGLVESELFGHERGAFSGALQRRYGRFELAHGGTIFLDEIGEVPKDVQVKLLRVLQEREFERVGGSQTIKCDVRVISATNRVLLRAIDSGDFRADLYYRLNVFPIDMPPLRERTDDIPLLVRFFAQKYGQRIGRQIDSIDSETMKRLVEYSWPGNIRELENVIERAVILSSPPQLHIELEPEPDLPRPGSVKLNEVQKIHIERTLRETNGVIEGQRGAAVRLGVKPATLRHRMRKLGIARNA